MKKVIALFAVIAFVATAAFAADTVATSTAAGTTATAATTTKADSLSVVGKIVGFKADKSKKTAGTLIVVDSAKKKFDFVVENTTAITAAKKPAKVAALKKNASVTVEYTAAGKVLTADSIKL